MYVSDCPNILGVSYGLHRRDYGLDDKGQVVEGVMILGSRPESSGLENETRTNPLRWWDLQRLRPHGPFQE